MNHSENHHELNDKTNKKKRKVPTQNQITNQPPTLNLKTQQQHQQQPITQTESESEIDQEPFQFLPIHHQFVDQLGLAKILSSHHVKMRMKPISSPRHYGRHLHKLTLTRALNSKPNSEHSTSTPVSPANSTKTSPIKPTSPSTKKSTTNLPSSVHLKRISKRHLLSSLNSKHKPPTALIKSKHLQILKLPVLPNLYDPTLSIHQIPSSSPSRSLPTSVYSTPDNDHKSQPKVNFSDGYDGQFTFRLEMTEMSERLAGLHLAISVDKRNRIVQIQEAMKIAMEKVDRSSARVAGGRSQASDPRTLINPGDLLALGLHPSGTPSDPRHTTSADLKLNPCSRRSSAPFSSRNPGFSTHHGPSGPPPSEPPPPLPHQQLTKTAKSHSNLLSSSALVPSTTTDTEDNNKPSISKKNPPPQKGKKKRSAHANANNIHHRDNYVPSRLPNRYQFNSASSPEVNPAKNHASRGNNDWSTFNFLAHDQFEDSLGGSKEYVFIDPNLSLLLGPLAAAPGQSTKSVKKGTKGDGETMAAGAGGKKAGGGQHCQLGRSAISRFFVEPEEWICSFCEYQLWFGDEVGLRKVIKDRKEVLRRRRRAQERAAKGVHMPSPPPAPAPAQDDDSPGATSDSHLQKAKKKKRCARRPEPPPAFVARPPDDDDDHAPGLDLALQPALRLQNLHRALGQLPPPIPSPSPPPPPRLSPLLPK